MIEVNKHIRILKWVEKNDMKTLHILRRVIMLKKSSSLRKYDLILRISDHFINCAAVKIQIWYRNNKKKKYYDDELNTTCPFTLEKPKWPYFVNRKDDDKIYHCYNLKPLVLYLGTSESRNSEGKPRCPISRKPFSKLQLIEIKKLADKEDLVIPPIKRISTMDIEKKAVRSLLDSTIGEITNLITGFDTNHTLVNYRRTIRVINEEIAPVILDNYLKLKRLDSEESDSFVKDSVNTINQEYDNQIKSHFIHLFQALSASG